MNKTLQKNFPQKFEISTGNKNADLECDKLTANNFLLKSFKHKKAQKSSF